MTNKGETAKSPPFLYLNERLSISGCLFKAILMRKLSKEEKERMSLDKQNSYGTIYITRTSL